MKKIIVLLSFIFVLSGCGNPSIEQSLKTNSMNIGNENKVLQLGYCPTMKNDAYNLQSKNQNMEIIEFDSAEETLNNLKNGRIDFALVGRKAKTSEIAANVSELKIEDLTYTLIASQKQIISESELTDLQINSCLSPDVEKTFSELNLIFKDCDYKNGSFWLVDWADMTDDLELLIPIDEQGQKIRKYRSAFLYTDAKQNQLNF